ncbi:unnamed protein product, partial [Didymodactylos carnosus]
IIINTARQQQQRRNGPRQLKLNDFMPPHLRDISTLKEPNLPLDFNLKVSGYTGTTNTRSTTPINVLTQQPRNFSTQIITTNNTAQPFHVNNNIFLITIQQDLFLNWIKLILLYSTMTNYSKIPVIFIYKTVVLFFIDDDLLRKEMLGPDVRLHCNIKRKNVKLIERLTHFCFDI